jgi:hypothetical protein
MKIIEIAKMVQDKLNPKTIKKALVLNAIMSVHSETANLTIDDKVVYEGKDYVFYIMDDGVIVTNKDSTEILNTYKDDDAEFTLNVKTHDAEVAVNAPTKLDFDGIMGMTFAEFMGDKQLDPEGNYYEKICDLEVKGKTADILAFIAMYSCVIINREGDHLFVLPDQTLVVFDKIDMTITQIAMKGHWEHILIHTHASQAMRTILDSSEAYCKAEVRLIISLLEEQLGKVVELSNYFENNERWSDCQDRLYEAAEQITKIKNVLQL